MSELKPCPFCGKSDIGMFIPLDPGTAAQSGPFAAFCPDCRTEGPDAWTAKGATDNWNNRKEQA